MAQFRIKKYGSGRVFRKIFPISESDILRNHQELLRKTEYCINCHHKIREKVYKFCLLRMQNKYALHVPLNCCGKGLKIMHLGPILMNDRVTVGQNCCIHINTALVARGTSDKLPTLKHGVEVRVGAVVLGGVIIADNVTIGANVVVNKSVEESDIAVASVPGKKVSDNGRSKWNKK